jgi:hypothetical protein
MRCGLVLVVCHQIEPEVRARILLTVLHHAVHHITEVAFPRMRDKARGWGHERRAVGELSVLEQIDVGAPLLCRLRLHKQSANLFSSLAGMPAAHLEEYTDVHAEGGHCRLEDTVRPSNTLYNTTQCEWNWASFHLTDEGPRGGLRPQMQ